MQQDRQRMMFPPTTDRVEVSQIEPGKVEPLRRDRNERFLRRFSPEPQATALLQTKQRVGEQAHGIDDNWEDLLLQYPRHFRWVV